MLGRLEDRRLMSVSVFMAEGGVLTVQGTTGAETVYVYEDNGLVLVQETTPGSNYSETFFRAAYTSLAVDLGADADGAFVDVKTLPTKIMTGAGTDTVDVFNGGTWIYVDAGDDMDRINIDDRASLIGTVAFGGSGDDAIKVDAGSDNGDSPTVALGGNGSDTLEGSGRATEVDWQGNIVTNDGSGHAILCGGNGSDILVSYNYETLVDGGNGKDTATLYNDADADTLISVERII